MSRNLTILTDENLSPLKNHMEKVGLKEEDVMREFEFAKQIINSSTYLQSLEPQSIFNAVMNTANLGLTLNIVSKEAALVPRSGKVLLEPMYVGLQKLLLSEEMIIAVNTQVIYENDVFDIDLGNNRKPITHKPTFGDRGKVLGAYTMFTTKDMVVVPEYMTLKEIEHTRNKSESYKRYVSKTAKGEWCAVPAWESEFGEMAKKTVLKRGIKRAPRKKSGGVNRLDEAIAITNIDYPLEETPKEILANENLLENLVEEMEEYNFLDKQKVIEYCQALSKKKAYKELGKVLELVKVRKEVDVIYGKMERGELKEAVKVEISKKWKSATDLKSYLELLKTGK